MEELVKFLNENTELYDKGTPVISDFQWDKAYFELKELEKKTGTVLPDSPTQKIHFKPVDKLEKVTHNHPMLSLDKTKDLEEVKNFIGEQDCLIMGKMDGLTCSLRYVDGKLVSAETRGNGEVGEDILHNAKMVWNIPTRIDYAGELILDGEVICDYDTFTKYFAEEYKNPRNFASGSIRLLDPQESFNRKLSFIVWEVIKGFDDDNSLNSKLNKVGKLGFHTVPRMFTAMIDASLANLVLGMCEAKMYPIDGLVFKFDDVAYGNAKGSTAHHLQNAIAYKLYDEIYESTLQDIDWTMGRTGVLTPVAVFDPIEIDGAIVSRANLHNVSVMLETLGHVWKGHKVDVFKANQIIPQIALNEDYNSETFDTDLTIRIPDICPICGGSTELIENDGVLVLKCTNPQCEGQLVNRIDHFVGKKGLDIKGLSKATIDKLIDWGWLNNLIDVFSLANYRSEWIKKSGFGVASVDKILNAIETGKETTLIKFISSLGIPLIGVTVAKEIAARVEDYAEFRDLIIDNFDFSRWDGFADSKTQALLEFDYSEADEIYHLLTISNEKPVVKSEGGLSFCITGSLQHFKNRKALEEQIESIGGKVSSSVSKKTNYLINNDSTSNSAKNLQAKKLNIPIITEQEFLENFC